MLGSIMSFIFDCFLICLCHRLLHVRYSAWYVLIDLSHVSIFLLLWSQKKPLLYRKIYLHPRANGSNTCLSDITERKKSFLWLCVSGRNLKLNNNFKIKSSLWYFHLMCKSHTANWNGVAKQATNHSPKIEFLLWYMRVLMPNSLPPILTLNWTSGGIIKGQPVIAH